MIDLLSDPKCTDIAWSWILVLFGTEGTSCNIIGADTQNMPYANAFAVLTAALAMFGALFMAYHTVAGIVSSAYTGKVLGERWHQIWAPLRIVFGFGLLIPVGGGFSSIHYILRDVVGVAAVQLGNNIIGAYVATAFKNVEGSTARVATLVGKSYADTFYDKELCVGVIKKDTSALFSVFAYEATSPKKAEKSVFNPGAIIAKTEVGYTWDFGDCGKVTLKDMTVDKIDDGFFFSGDQNNGILSSSAAGDMLNEFNKARYQATEALFQKIKAANTYEKLGEAINQNLGSIKEPSAGLLKKLREDTVVNPGARTALDMAAAEWNKAVSDAASKVFRAMTDGARAGALNLLPEYGFMMAGGYERSLSALSGMVSGISNTQLGTVEPNVDQNTQAKLRLAKMVVGSSNVRDNDGGGAQADSESGDGKWQMIMASILPANMYNMFFSEVSNDPVGDMIMFGNNLLATASYAVMALGMLKVASGVAAGNLLTGVTGLGAGAQAFVDYIGNWLSWIIMIMVVVGLIHSFALPMLPMIMIFTMGISWLIMFLEGAIAGVLWAFVFIRMDGTEFFDQKQSPGVGLLFNLLLRPGLGMLAFCGMLVLLPALLNALNQVWLTAFSLQAGNHGISIVSLWQWAAGMVMFCWMQWTLTLRLTSLIPTISDRVGHWMGISSTSGYGDSQETAANVGAVIAASQALSKAPIGGGQKRGQQPGPSNPDIPQGNPEAKRSSIGKNGGNKWKK